MRVRHDANRPQKEALARHFTFICYAFDGLHQCLYGNKAVLLQLKNKENHTHRWTLYVRAYDPEEDLGHYIRKVQFRLHESYPNNVRIVERPPFEITETGWGEFDAQMKMYFVDVNEKPVTAFHYIRLHHPLVTLKNGSTMVLKEHYDEIVFNEPTEPMYGALMKFHSYKKSPSFEQARHHLRELLDSQNKEIVGEIEDLKRSLKDACELMQKYRQERSEGARGEQPDEGQQSAI
uniref:Protein AF-9 homolog n=1 Tax=Globodera rostochiensis TaxID=31243 RepID=A0A914HED2_GLORO